MSAYFTLTQSTHTITVHNLHEVVATFVAAGSHDAHAGNTTIVVRTFNPRVSRSKIGLIPGKNF